MHPHGHIVITVPGLLGGGDACSKSHARCKGLSRIGKGCIPAYAHHLTSDRHTGEDACRRVHAKLAEVYDPGIGMHLNYTAN
jgi:hypothetical protein